MAKRGPKIKTVDWVEFDKLCQIQCTLAEIAAWFKCSEDTIERIVKREKSAKFAEYYEQNRGVGKIALRRRQFQAAMAGDRTMLVWLGKQYLEQSDKIEQRIDATAELVHVSDEEIERRTKDLLQRISDATTKLPAPEDID